MAQYYVTDHVIQQPTIEVYINGNKQENVIVSSLTLSVGIEPAELYVLFPTRLYGEYPCSEGDQVKLYVNRALYKNPLFRGICTGFDSGKTVEAGEYVGVQFLDETTLLKYSVIAKDYNQKDRLGNYIENLTIRDLAKKINEVLYSDTGSLGPKLSLPSFPLDLLYEFNVTGMPLDSVITNMLEKADGKYFLVREYQEFDTIIKARKVGVGPIFDLVAATDRTKHAWNQPDGNTNAANIRRNISYQNAINAAVVIGDKKL